MYLCVYVCVCVWMYVDTSGQSQVLFLEGHTPYYLSIHPSIHPPTHHPSIYFLLFLFMHCVNVVCVHGGCLCAHVHTLRDAHVLLV